MRDRQPVLFHVIDMLGPEIDKGHVLARLDHVRAGIAADRPGADHRNFLSRRHVSPPRCFGTARQYRVAGIAADPSTRTVPGGSSAEAAPGGGSWRAAACRSCGFHPTATKHALYPCPGSILRASVSWRSRSPGGY